MITSDRSYFATLFALFFDVQVVLFTIRILSPPLMKPIKVVGVKVVILLCVAHTNRGINNAWHYAKPLKIML